MTANRVRPGPRPRTSRGTPHHQLDQQPIDPTIREKLARRAFALTGVTEEPSGISVPGARALVLKEDRAVGPQEAFMVGREFAHLHPPPDQSLHMALPAAVARRAIEAGWAERHPASGTGHFGDGLVMVYAPRDHGELEEVFALLVASYEFASGAVPQALAPR